MVQSPEVKQAASRLTKRNLGDASFYMLLNTPWSMGGGGQKNGRICSWFWG